MEPGEPSNCRKPASSARRTAGGQPPNGQRDVPKSKIVILFPMLGTYHLNALFEILNKLHFVYEPLKLWRFVLEQACKTVQAEAGTYFELTDDEKQMKVCAAYGMDERRLGEIMFP